MIYIIALNPYLDKTIDIEELVYDDVNEIVEEKNHACGKGIDVSRVIKELGGQSIVLGLIGGYSGLELESMLINEGIICDFTHINSETKTNITVYQKRKKIQTLLSTTDPVVSPIELTTFLNKIKEIPRNSFAVITGNAPGFISDNFYAQLILILKEKNIKVILDTDGTALKNGISASPYLIKPNIHEFGRLVEKNISGIDEIIEYAKPYKNVVEYIVVSMGVMGALAISNNIVYHVIPPKIKVGSSIGAGDSLVAGIVFSLSTGNSFEEALTLGVASGTAATLNQGRELCKKEDIDKIKKEVNIKII
ncbi:MAG: 1-phosphofructokinase family hexose kinase [Proteobacteria bacterium]|nr:1-phosphofructokinase family hexose kinase [Pseudomonadota bacterium]